ncbi:tRNA lysidine(34) synthetase [Methanosphaerula palustris]|uniref:PP-loop domain-containing protein n=1 Tax=Methanosphaerula palustris (strain ATCC BAA-1556 / DSM 19958 / E1-9c) TaxID=521011 RepID=B8GHC8_METPE|nr:PP-loop domain-containing protein [Methanosphaerula palustris]ACL16533.1 PP-loop domain-containing protein [Methanosphaerula palustris E1-9c]
MLPIPGTTCSRCRRPAVIVQQYSGLSLCEEHLRRDLETKAKRLIRQHHWVRAGGSIAVALSGRIASSALLLFLQQLLADRRDLTLIAFTLYQGDAASPALLQASALASALGITWQPILCRWLASNPGDFVQHCCSAAAVLGADAVAVGETLDDRAVTVLTKVCSGEQRTLVGAGPDCGIRDRVSVITPFSGIPFDEVAVYAGSLPVVPLPSRVPDPGSLSGAVDAIVAAYSVNHPSTRYALLSVYEQLAVLNNPGDGTP